MEDIRTAIRLIQRHCYMATVDLRDAYFALPIQPSDRKYLRFFLNDVYYEFTCLPFGLRSAPVTFTKLIKPIAAYLRSQNITCVLYLDDFLLLASTIDECRTSVNFTVHLLESLSFTINTEKSILEPSQSCRFLGFILDSAHMRLRLPPDKTNYILYLISTLENRTSCSIKKFAKLIGGNFKARIGLTPEIKQDLHWWKHHLVSDIGNEIGSDHFTMEIFSDASLSGWGIYCQGHTARGLWNPEEQREHINYLELKAVLYGLKCFAKHLLHSKVLLRIDNTTAISYINRMGSVQYPHLSTLTRQIWQWCEARDIWLVASYINSTANIEADRESRAHSDATEWELSDRYFNQILEKFHEAKGILVVPDWPSQPWYPLFNKLLTTTPLKLGPDINLLSSPFRATHPLSATLALMAGSLSGKLSYGGESQRR
ncbi:uncharacterized protein LOC135131605 [Zophobas morio]|uniref:uncharacterized protein LOC135131605 n=1 Tax=Zophobas morio TaxID=2755281 RepID=UPI00308365E5